MAAWQPWIERYGLNRAVVLKHNGAYSMRFALQMVRCFSDDERRILLGISAE